MADLTSLANVKSYRQVGGSNEARDAELERLITSASAWFQRQVGGRQIRSASFAETITHDGTDVLLPLHVPVTAISTFTADSVTVPSQATNGSGWYLENGSIRLKDWYIPDGAIVSLAYTAGDAAALANVPGDVEQAVIEMVWLKFAEAPHVGIQSQAALGMNVSYLPTIIPQSVRDVIDGYRRVSV